MLNPNTRIGFVHKDLTIEQYVLKWPLTSGRLEQREDRTLLREKHTEWKSVNHVRQVMLHHDLAVLRKWVTRKLLRQKAILVNEAEVSGYPTMDFSIVKEFRVIQHAIPYDPDAYEKFGQTRVFVPPGRRVLTIAVMAEPSVVWSEI